MEIKVKIDAFNAEVKDGRASFKGRLFINKRYIGTFSNNATDSGTTISPRNELVNEWINSAENFLKIRSSLIGGKVENREEKIQVTSFLKSEIERQVAGRHQQYEERFREEINEPLMLAQQRKIIYGVPFLHYSFIELPRPISIFLKNPPLHDELSRFIHEKVLPKMSSREVIMNDNIPESIFKKAWCIPFPICMD